MLLAFKLSTVNPLSFFSPMKKTYFFLYIRSKPRNGLENVVYKCPFPQGSRGLMPWAAGGIFPAPCAADEVLIAALGTGLLRQTCGLVPCLPHITCPLVCSQCLCSEFDHKLIHLVMTIYGEGAYFQESFSHSRFSFCMSTGGKVRKEQVQGS